MYKLGFREAEDSEIKLPTFIGSGRKQGSSRKTPTFASLTAKAFGCMDHNKLENSLRDGINRSPHLSPEKPVYGSRSNSDNWIMEQLSGSKLGEE